MSSIVNGAEYLAFPRSPETWLIRPLLPVGGLMAIYGDPKVGKSYAALQLASCLSSGSGDWLGFGLPQKAKTVYIQLDTPRSLWSARLSALLESGLPVDHLLLADRETLNTWPFDIMNPEHYNLLRSALKLHAPDVVILDTLREAHRADENDSTEMQKVMSTLSACVQPAALIVVAHARKPSPDGNKSLLSDMRGSGYIVGAADAIVRFSHKAAYFTSRALEEGSVKLERLDNGLWAPLMSEVDQHLSSVLLDPSLTSIRARGRELAARSGLSESAAIMRVRRAS